MAIEGNDYGHNDLVAFAEDLRFLDAWGYEIQPLHALVDAWLTAPETLENRRLVALTCDDGSDFDARDLPHPVAGMQRSILGHLREFRARHPERQTGLHVTSFVIVSREARDQLDKACMVGRHWWNDDWWAEAIASGLMGIANHSWDHNHDLLSGLPRPDCKHGDFASVDREEVAEFEIGAASERLRRDAPGPSARLFAYPYGETNPFLLEEYFPQHAKRIQVDAAFTTVAEPWTNASSRWTLPRYVFRRDWSTPRELKQLLDAAG